jgi:raffinose/stachyose/melibiose transport system substrate-binding protein
MSPLMKKALALNNELTTYGGDVFEYDEITSMQDVIRNSLVGMMLGTTPEDTAKTIQAEIDNNQ